MYDSAASAIRDELSPSAIVELNRKQIAIHIADGTNRRLVERRSVQLNLESIFVDDDCLRDPQNLEQVALLVEDETAACRYRELPTIPEHLGDKLQPALVAVVSSSYAESTLLPRKSGYQLFDGAPCVRTK